MNLEEAQELEVKMTERFLQMINSDEKLRPFLKEAPFSAQRAPICVTFVEWDEQDREVCRTEGIAQVRQEKNQVFYSTYKKGRTKLTALSKEPYAKALEKVTSPMNAT